MATKQHKFYVMFSLDDNGYLECSDLDDTIEGYDHDYAIEVNISPKRKLRKPVLMGIVNIE